MASDTEHTPDINPELETLIHLVKDTVSKPPDKPYDEAFEPPNDIPKNFIPREEL
ncbi:MAG: hypothetical protein ACT6RZ_02165 [Methylophilus sp.]|uniref:hypothetical protein n=1 Tax=Methylophilus sp. TaxID=29541 RepID=UPI00403706E9